MSGSRRNSGSSLVSSSSASSNLSHLEEDTWILWGRIVNEWEEWRRKKDKLLKVSVSPVNGWCKKYTAIINDPDHLQTIDTWLLAQSLNVCHEKQNMVLKNTVSTHKEENVILPKHLQLRISSQYPACTRGVFAFRSDTRFCLACLTEHQALSKPSAETDWRNRQMDCESFDFTKVLKEALDSFYVTVHSYD